MATLTFSNVAIWRKCISNVSIYLAVAVLPLVVEEWQYPVLHRVLVLSATYDIHKGPKLVLQHHDLPKTRLCSEKKHRENSI